MTEVVFDHSPEANTAIQGLFELENPVVLISGDRPGCGSSTIATNVLQQIEKAQGTTPELISVGGLFRSRLSAGTERELGFALPEINDPLTFNRELFESIPDDRPVVVDGKLATRSGPHFIDPAARPVVSINLTSPEVFSAKRVMQREGLPFWDFLITDQDAPEQTQFLEYLYSVRQRETHDREMRDQFEVVDNDEILHISIDTGMYSPGEIADVFANDETSFEQATKWELHSLDRAAAVLAGLLVARRRSTLAHPSDANHVSHNIDSFNYNLMRLETSLNPEGTAVIRKAIKRALIDSWYGFLIKHTPRFFETEDGTIAIDNESQQWTPDYYKIAEGWPTISTLLKDKSILDPYAGAGTLVNMLISRDVPSSVVYADLSYTGGSRLNGTSYRYQPKLNIMAARLLFDDLPSWYKPSFEQARGFVTSDSRTLPFASNSVDHVLADPPYGKNCDGSVGLFLGSIEEFKRVSRISTVALVPIDWLNELRAANVNFRQLTRDLSGGQSGFPVCFVEIPK